MLNAGENTRHKGPILECARVSSVRRLVMIGVHSNLKMAPADAVVPTCSEIGESYDNGSGRIMSFPSS